MNKAILLDSITIINSNINSIEIIPFLTKYFKTTETVYNYKTLKSDIPNIENLLLIVKKSDIEYDIIKTIKKCDSILNLYQYYISYNKEHSILLLDVKLNKSNISDVYRVSSAANLTLSVVHCISEIDFNLDDHIVVDENNRTFLRDMWMIFDRNGKYLSIYKTLDGARQYVINLNGNGNGNGIGIGNEIKIENGNENGNGNGNEKSSKNIYYPDISQEDNKLNVVSLSYNDNNLLNYATRVKINISKGSSIKLQIIHWQKINAEYIHKYIFQ